MKEIVKYDNRMNVLNFKGFGKVDMNLLMALCSRMKGKMTEKIVMTFDEIKHLANYTSTDKEEFIKDLERMIDRLMRVNSRIITDGKIAKFVLFPTFLIDPKEETVSVAVNQDFAFLLNELNQYTTFELEEFVDLKSKYSKNLYRLLKQWRTVGKYTFNDLAEFRNLMDVPKSYSNKYMMERCVDVAIEEISKLDISFNGFKCEPVYARKRGNPLDKLVFTWQAEKHEFIPKVEDEQIDGQMNIADYPECMPDESHLDKIVEIMKAKGISKLDAQKIYDSAKGDMNRISEVYESLKNQKSDNFVAKMVAMVKPDSSWQKPIKTAKQTTFHNTDHESYVKANSELLKKIEGKEFF